MQDARTPHPDPARKPDAAQIRRHRRRFLKEMGAWSLGILVTTAARGLPSAQADEDGFTAGFSRPPLPGACVSATSDTERCLAAVVDTVVPGKETDPEGTPGALEACAMNLMVDGAFPFRSYASLITTLVDGMAKDEGAERFIDLAYEPRLAVLVRAQQALPVIRLAFRAIRSTYYGGAYNGVGLDALGYPGPNLGYRHLPEASHRCPVCRERTETGWMP